MKHITVRFDGDLETLLVRALTKMRSANLGSRITASDLVRTLVVQYAGETSTEKTALTPEQEARQRGYDDGGWDDAWGANPYK